YQLVRAQPLDLPFLQDTQQLDLEGHRQALDFIQEHRSAVRPLDFSYPPPVCAGEGAEFMAEDLAFEQLLGKTAAVDRHELSVAPARVLMQAARNELLAGACLAVDYDVGRSVGKIEDRAADLLDQRGSAKQRGLDANPIAQFVAERGHFEGQLALLGGAAHHLHQELGGKWFFDEVVRARAHGLDGHRDIAVTRHQDDGELSLDFRRVAQQTKPVHSGQLDVAHHDCWHAGLDVREGAFGGFERLDRQAGELQRLHTADANGGVVLDQQDLDSVRHRASPLRTRVRS